MRVGQPFQPVIKKQLLIIRRQTLEFAQHLLSGFIATRTAADGRPVCRQALNLTLRERLPRQQAATRQPSQSLGSNSACNSEQPGPKRASFGVKSFPRSPGCETDLLFQIFRGDRFAYRALAFQSSPRMQRTGERFVLAQKSLGVHDQGIETIDSQLPPISSPGSPPKNSTPLV